METFIVIMGVVGIVFGAAALIGGIVLVFRALGYYEKKAYRQGSIPMIGGVIMTAISMILLFANIPIVFPEFTAEFADAYENITGRETAWTREG